MQCKSTKSHRDEQEPFSRASREAERDGGDEGDEEERADGCDDGVVIDGENGMGAMSDHPDAGICSCGADVGDETEADGEEAVGVGI